MKIRYIIMFQISFLMTCCNTNNENQTIKPVLAKKSEEIKDIEARRLNLKGIESSNNENYLIAKLYFFEALRIEPNNSTILNNIGLLYSEQENLSKAKEYFNMSLKASDSTNFLPCINLGNLYLKTEEHNKGINILNYALANSNDNFIINGAYINRAYHYFKLGDCLRANDDLKYLRNNAKDDAEYIHISKLMHELKACKKINKKLDNLSN